MPPTIDAKVVERAFGQKTALCGRSTLAGQPCLTPLAELWWDAKQEIWKLNPPEGRCFSHREGKVFEVVRRSSTLHHLPRGGSTVICPSCQFRNVVRGGPLRAGTYVPSRLRRPQEVSQDV
jgi:LSD1 subclass zinc finger protein